jgi:GTPase SAR1 family protein
MVGLAGSGKSLLAATYLDWLRSTEQNAISLNLDPGATNLPYGPDVDVRNYVNIYQLMDEYGLGPNGALIVASDLAADHFEEMKAEIDESRPDILVVDTPGQIELFAFRESGSLICKLLSEERQAIIYLLDAPFCKRPFNFLSNIFLAAAVHSRLAKPQVYALTKSDLISDEEIDQIISWSVEPEALQSALQREASSMLSLIGQEIAETIVQSGLIFEPIPVSAKMNQGILELNAAVTRILSGGEEARP